MHLAAHGVEAALATAVLEVPRTRPADPILGIRDILLAKEAAKTNAMMDAPPRHMAVAGSSEAPCPVDSSSQPDGSILAISMQHRAISMRHDAITMRAVATTKRAQAEEAAAAAASALFAAKAAEAAAAAALSEAEAVEAAAVEAEMALLERREGSETSLASSAFRHLDRLERAGDLLLRFEHLGVGRSLRSVCLVQLFLGLVTVACRELHLSGPAWRPTPWQSRPAPGSW
jgi:hypothetical protein